MTQAISDTASFPAFQVDRKSYNIVTTQSKVDANPNRCWMNIVKKKLYSFSDNTPWLFDCYVDGNRYVYRSTVKDLQTAFNTEDIQYMEKEAKYAFYIDYAQGILYTTEYESTGRAMLGLKVVQDGDEYQRLMQRMYKQVKSHPGKIRSDNQEMKIGMFIRTQFIPTLVEYCRNGKLSLRDIDFLFHEQLLNGYPILKRANEVRKGRNCRYYAKVITLFGIEYRICDHWFVKDKGKLRRILRTLNMNIAI